MWRRCKEKLLNWEQAVTHVGLHHEKLFYALKHSEDEDYKHIMKRFYPEKYKKVCATPSKTSPAKQNENPTQITEADPLILLKFGVKRKLSVANTQENENRTDVKRTKKGQPKSETDGPSTSSSAKPSIKVDSTTTAPNSKAVKQVLICEICPPGHSATYTSRELCQGHMAEAHFQDWILAQFPAQGGKCGFPTCSVTLHSAADRAKHLGLRHKQVLLALRSHLLVSKAKEVALKKLQANKEPVNGDQKDQLKPLRSGSLSEVLGSLQKSLSAQGSDDSKDRYDPNNAESKSLGQVFDFAMGADEPEKVIIDVDGTSSANGDGEKTCKDCGGWLKVSVDGVHNSSFCTKIGDKHYTLLH